MTRNRRHRKQKQLYQDQEVNKFVETFEAEYARILETEGLEAAKAFFRENFIVQCFACGYLGKTVPPLNCAHCGTYLD